MQDARTKPVWPGWETVRLIGRGNFGAVYEIEREVFGYKEKAALKVITIPQSESEIDELLSEGYDKKSITTRYEGYLHDIVREYSMMADMKGCANIVYCDDVKYIQHGNGIGWDIYIKMELLTALPRVLGKSISCEQVVKIGTDICSALAFCEKRNLLHRDIKPQNMFVAPDGTCKLGDFGIAKTAEHTASGTKTGTYKYMAPEVYNNQPYGAKADIYSLGLVLYWLLNERRTPFLPLPPVTPTSTEEEQARARRFNGETIPAPAHGSEELKRIVLKACAYDVKDRYQSAEDMLRDLENLNNPAWHARQSYVQEPEEEGTVCVSPASDPPKPATRPLEQDPEADETVPVYRTEEKKRQENAGRPSGTQKKGRIFVPLIGILALTVVLLFVLLSKGGGTEPRESAASETIPQKHTATEGCRHVWAAATCTTPKTCTVCGAVEGTALGHTWAAATCTTPKTCIVCGAVEGTALGHTWADATYTAPKTCTVCGATEGSVLPTPSPDPTLTPSAADLDSIDAKIAYPTSQQYLSAYRTAVVRPPSGNSVYGFADPNRGFDAYYFLVSSGEPVTVIAEGNSYACVILTNQGCAAWINKKYLVYD